MKYQVREGEKEGEWGRERPSVIPLVSRKQSSSEADHKIFSISSPSVLSCPKNHDVSWKIEYSLSGFQGKACFDEVSYLSSAMLPVPTILYVPEFSARVILLSLVKILTNSFILQSGLQCALKRQGYHEQPTVWEIVHWLMNWMQSVIYEHSPPHPIITY